MFEEIIKLLFFVVQILTVLMIGAAIADHIVQPWIERIYKK